ncbi:hypothetical protein AQUCO_11100019v1 [Aquilegia coerulea]|uniref:RNA-binding S4 domain-containing protein n=1 Tax=Aquilegia coerulea TaxID=218851 RepID=A0A2G5C2T6_AQUCA|nr:hypothetical protein AQUCO_11100019v1 [Aquilegia coerulea]
MLSLSCSSSSSLVAFACCCSSSSSKILCSSSSLLSLLPLNPRRKSITRSLSSSSSAASIELEESISSESSNGNYAGVQLQEIVQIEKNNGDGLWKSRIDSWISSRIHGVSRARVQSSIRAGLVTVNGRIIDKVSHVIRAGDKVNCTISELQPLRAVPEDIPIDIVYEDEHVLVVNKPAHMVVHPAPGNANGTLVNGLLNHCNLPTITLQSNDILSESEDDCDNEDNDSIDDQTSCMEISPNMTGSSVRPGIVHRLDKGTSGLLVVAKDEHSHAHLSEQFKQHTIHRVYVSLTSGVPSTLSGRVEVPIGRDTNNRVRMAAIPGPNISRQTPRQVQSNGSTSRWWFCIG